jgi:hypothetical protein
MSLSRLNFGVLLALFVQGFAEKCFIISMIAWVLSLTMNDDERSS